MALPLAAMFWRAFDSGELQKNLTSDMVMHAMRLSAITSTISLLLAIIFGTPVAYLLAQTQLPRQDASSTCWWTCRSCCRRRSPVWRCWSRSGGAACSGSTSMAAASSWRSPLQPCPRPALRLGALLHPHRQGGLREQFRAGVRGRRGDAGRDALRIFFRILLPLSWPSVVAGAILCWARGLSELGATLIFAGNFEGRTQTMPLAIIGVFDAGRSINVADRPLGHPGLRGRPPAPVAAAAGAAAHVQCSNRAVRRFRKAPRRFSSAGRGSRPTTSWSSPRRVRLRQVADLARHRRSADVRIAGEIELPQGVVSIPPAASGIDRSRRSAAWATWCRTWRCSPS